MATTHPAAANTKGMVCALEPEPPVLLASVFKKDDRDSGSTPASGEHSGEVSEDKMATTSDDTLFQSVDPMSTPFAIHWSLAGVTKSVDTMYINSFSVGT